MKMRFVALETIVNPENGGNLVTKGMSYIPEELETLSKCFGVDNIKAHVIMGATDRDCLLAQIAILENMLFNS